MHIKQFQELIRKRYARRDLQKGTPATFMWFVEEVGELATILAEKDSTNREKQEEFADVFAWLCTLANINDVDIESACKKYTESQQQDYK